MRLAWVTDPHLNHVPLPAWQRWIDAVLATCSDAVLITGDISESDDVVFQLQRAAEALYQPVYFVLGNHDFYQGSIAGTRQSVSKACRGDSPLTYLTDSDPLELQPDIFLIGEDGWGDAVIGDYENSPIRLNDFALIQDFSWSPSDDWKDMLREQGRDSAARLERKIRQLPDTAKQVLVATHVPPFRESCWYMGKTTDDNWAPFFVCGQTGRVLREASEARPDCQFTVVCGHTHHGGISQMTPNLTVRTGAAEYGSPGVEATIEIGPPEIFF